ncbi:MAG: hypothetical protein ACO2ON_03910 [Candidatus Nanopusillus sp.]
MMWGYLNKIGSIEEEVEEAREDLEALYLIIDSIKRSIETRNYTKEELIEKLYRIQRYTDTLSLSLRLVYRKIQKYDPMNIATLNVIGGLLNDTFRISMAFGEILKYFWKNPVQDIENLYRTSVWSLEILEKARRDLAMIIGKRIL